jgi:protein tyrosine phosphatase
VPIFCCFTCRSVEPQPAGLPAPWEQILVVPSLGKKGSYSTVGGVGALMLFKNPVDGTLQQGDPRPNESADQLPEGWESAFDDEGDQYFVDRNTGMMTFDDPRDGFEPTASTFLMGKVNNAVVQNLTRRMTLANHGFVPPKEEAKVVTVKQWHIGACDAKGYDDLDFMLVEESDIPPDARDKLHNRYLDILPTPRTRVQLPEIVGIPGSSYINANFVRGADGNPNAFIAAMGPLPGTLNTFWRMIWQEKPVVIVMITGLVESGKTKCERYWPGIADSKTMLQFGDIRVVCTATEPSPGFIKSTLKITGFDSKTGKRTSHTMIHYWYNTWPDHGVPRKKENPMYVDDVLTMLQEVNAYCSQLEKSKKPSGPILVHCSAGIGRTGTYIAVDHEIKSLESIGEANPLAIVESLRKDRPAMVQHPMQFKFVHEAAVRHSELRKMPFKVAGEADEERPPPAKVAADAKEEKDLAMTRRQQAGAGTEHAKSVRRASARTKRANSGLNLGTVAYQGLNYEFLDTAASGFMSVEEASSQKMPAEFFRMINKSGNGQITPAEFQKFKRQQAMLNAVSGF